MSARQFDQFRASSLYCQACEKAMPVSEKLLLVLPDRELTIICVAAAEVRSEPAKSPQRIS
jgi:hypothetical protein